MKQQLDVISDCDFKVWLKPPSLHEAGTWWIGIGKYVAFSITDVTVNDHESLRHAVSMCKKRAEIILSTDDDTLIRSEWMCCGNITAKLVKADLLLQMIAVGK